jgi:CRP-like cAMP-binding protein
MASRLPYQPLPLEVAAGHVLLRQDDCADIAWEVLSGAFAERARDAEGRSLMLDIAGPGDITGGLPGQPALWEVQALCAGSFRVWTGPLDAAASRWAKRFSGLASDVVWLDVVTRLERRLEDLALRFGVAVPGGVRITLSLTHEDLAALVGASRESVSRAMSELRAVRRVRTSGRGRIVLATPLHVVGDTRM